MVAVEAVEVALPSRIAQAVGQVEVVPLDADARKDHDLAVALRQRGRAGGRRPHRPELKHRAHPSPPSFRLD